ncbi:MAG TPA: hypothetical protein VFI74_03440 [Candidatus Saccharimonadales bacterium]|nr:hypothetical protein [Candidatus Saccharimonadales bacterium]
MRQLDNIVNREVTRKEFLATMGFGIASILGFSTLLKLLFGRGSEQHRSSFGYGDGVYGGRKTM